MAISDASLQRPQEIIVLGTTYRELAGAKEAGEMDQLFITFSELKNIEAFCVFAKTVRFTRRVKDTPVISGLA